MRSSNGRRMERGTMNAGRIYRDRYEAGRILGGHVRSGWGTLDPIVLALPRGGVPVGVEVARALNAPLDVYVVRKLGVPGHEELAMGAIAGNGFEVLDQRIIAQLGISRFQIAAMADRQTQELHRQERLYRTNRPALEFRGRALILVDDGLATGFTLRAAIGSLRLRDAGRILVAVPVGAVESCAEIAREADGLVCPLQPDPFLAVGQWYENFRPTTDDEVQRCLAASEEQRHRSGTTTGRWGTWI
jgi:putative phosphoribosyl transferase